MKYTIHLSVIVLSLFLFNSCKKEDPSKDRYYKGNWKLEKIETNVLGGSKVEQEINKGEIKFKGYRKNAKRGSYNVSYTLNYFNQQEQQMVTESISNEGEFVWWVSTLQPNTQYESYRLVLDLDSFDDRLFGVGGHKSFGQGTSVFDTEIIDNNTFVLKISGTEKYNNLVFSYTFGRQ